MDRGERKWIWEPTREWIEQTNVYRFMQRLGIGDRAEFIRFSQEHIEEFWAEMVAEVGRRWTRPDDLVLDTSRGVEWASVDEDGRWFLHGRSDESMNAAGRRWGGPMR